MRDNVYKLAVKGIIENKEGKILLLKRSCKHKKTPGVWDLPGGEVADNENFVRALNREILEETGLMSYPKKLYGAVERPNKKVCLVFVSSVFDIEPIILSEEHDEFKWVNLLELIQTDITPKFRDILEQYLSKKGGVSQIETREYDVAAGEW